MPALIMQPLRVSLVQGATRWHDAPANRDYYGALVRQAKGSDLIVLPETFLSGFSNDIQASADTMDGEGVAWLRALAVEVRSEERRVGKEGVRTCRSRWWQDH